MTARQGLHSLTERPLVDGGRAELTTRVFGSIRVAGRPDREGVLSVSSLKREQWSARAR